MGFYSDRILPHLINASMRKPELQPYREWVGSAKGRVLEVGVGSGLNLPIYGAQVEEIVGPEPAPHLIGMAKRVADQAKAPVRFIAGSAEALPIETASVDTVVMTWTLCSIPDAISALKEMRRVLREGGELRGGFVITQLDTGYMKGPRPMTYFYEGRASPA
jgi:ubiquinone/menaquinone biosynthesis C-methylase UbiE